MKKNKKKKSTLRKGNVFPNRKEIENLLNIDPAEILETPPLEMPSKKEIENFLKKPKKNENNT